MTIDYQGVLDLIVAIMGFAFPIYIIFEICARIMNIFLDFVAGSKFKRL